MRALLRVEWAPLNCTSHSKLKRVEWALKNHWPGFSNSHECVRALKSVEWVLQKICGTKLRGLSGWALSWVHSTTTQPPNGWFFEIRDSFLLRFQKIGDAWEFIGNSKFQILIPYRRNCIAFQNNVVSDEILLAWNKLCIRSHIEANMLDCSNRGIFDFWFPHLLNRKLIYFRFMNWGFRKMVAISRSHLNEMSLEEPKILQNAKRPKWVHSWELSSAQECWVSAR